ncbi:hypothetical protein ULMS_18870 [Patiriisocius marinistellae]|uniref:Peptidase M19 n=1 Tax=Patiriisocius marinistellae TaxID=2494560 RepID=A0A5J4G196_9FLAO|nr:membrane dipeptidase [Patiriisocius marinistellae]GEQ86379.1 hypothetical protein ULMS_18870 [Patiriisocius marinistellae]
MKTNYIDIHCHPALKPYSKSFKYSPTKKNMLDAGRKNSIWHYSPPTVLEKFLNRIVTLTKFSQTDLTTMAMAGTKTVIVSLYPFEKHFLTKPVLGWKGLTEVLVNLAASISQKRIDYVNNHEDYFKDLIDEYDFYKQLDNQVQKIGGIFYTYRLVNSYAEILENKKQETSTKKIINIILSIEGGHSLNTGLELNRDTGSPDEVLANLQKIKNWEKPPLFMTFAHHFYNELCGHSESISIGLLKDNQKRGMNEDITELGRKVLHHLLDDSNGKRIYIDVKHMNTRSRKTYYKILETIYSDVPIPIIASHGAVNGMRSIIQWNETNFPESTQFFNNIDINFYDEELIRIAKSNGVFGIQLDERRIGSKKAINESKIWIPNKRKQLKKKSLLVWRQVEHCAKVLDKEGLFCWGIQTIGSDFDGIVNPIKGLWTAENIKDLAEEMVHHATSFISSYGEQLQPFNRITGEAIVERVLNDNAVEFLKRWFK